MRLTSTQVKPTRLALLTKQSGRCQLCGLPCSADEAVLDHNHNTGAVRGVLHRGCNSLLGKLENNAARYGVRDIGIFANGVANYLRMHITNITGYLHPTHKTVDEKRVLRNKRARTRRALIKESA